MSNTILKVANVSKRFGGLQALSDVGITIERGQVYGLIGPNGAGKTTFFNVLTGLYTPDSGSFELAGKPYTPTAVHEVAKAGIARTFQNIRLFAEMTALENVMVGRHVRTHSGLIGAVLRTPGFKREEKAITDRARELLAYVGIEKFADLKGKRISTGAPASGTDVMSMRLLEAHGLDPNKDVTRERLSVGESVSALKDGKIDALMWVGGVPTPGDPQLGSAPGERANSTKARTEVPEAGTAGPTASASASSAAVDTGSRSVRAS